MIGSRFSPEIRQALRVDISATLLFRRHRTAKYVAIGATLAGVRGIAGPPVLSR